MVHYGGGVLRSITVDLYFHFVDPVFSIWCRGPPVWCHKLRGSTLKITDLHVSGSLCKMPLPTYFICSRLVAKLVHMWPCWPHGIYRSSGTENRRSSACRWQPDPNLNTADIIFTRLFPKRYELKKIIQRSTIRNWKASNCCFKEFSIDIKFGLRRYSGIEFKKKDFLFLMFP